MKESESVYKDISVFLREMLKCPICYTTTKDEVPHVVIMFFAFRVLTNSQQGRMTSVLFASSGEGLCTQFHSPEWRNFVKKNSMIPGGISSIDNDLMHWDLKTAKCPGVSNWRLFTKWHLMAMPCWKEALWFLSQGSWGRDWGPYSLGRLMRHMSSTTEL